MDDAELIARFLDGDREAVEHVRGWIRGAFTPYRARLAAELEDLEQEVLIQLMDNLGTGRFQAASSLATYTRSYVHHKCIDRLRSLSRRQWVDVEDLDLESRRPSALDALTGQERAETALRVLAEMPESCRELWRMLQDGMRYAEMSRRLGVSEGTLRARVLRCRRQALKARKKILGNSA